MSNFRCNHCWELLKSPTACITPCSHIFCIKDAQGWFSNSSECPCCNKILNRENEVRQIDFEPNLQMELWGLSPSAIIDVTQSALGFWEYQKEQEIAWHQHTIKVLQGEIVRKERTHKDKMVQVQNAMNSLTHQIESLQEDNKRKKQAYHILEEEYKEKARQCRKYEQLYKSLRKKSPRDATSPVKNLQVQPQITSNETALQIRNQVRKFPASSFSTRRKESPSSRLNRFSVLRGNSASPPLRRLYTPPFGRSSPAQQSSGFSRNSAPPSLFRRAHKKSRGRFSLFGGDTRRG